MFASISGPLSSSFLMAHTNSSMSTSSSFYVLASRSFQPLLGAPRHFFFFSFFGHTAYVATVSRVPVLQWMHFRLPSNRILLLSFEVNCHFSQTLLLPPVPTNFWLLGTNIRDWRSHTISQVRNSSMHTSSYVVHSAEFRNVSQASRPLVMCNKI